MKLKCVKIKYDLEGEAVDAKTLSKTLPKTRTVEIDNGLVESTMNVLESLSRIDRESAGEQAIEEARELFAEKIEAETGYPVSDFEVKDVL